MKHITLNFHSDPGHGWLEMPKTLARQLGQAFCNAISVFSYQDKYNLYLEQDDDASLALKTLEENGFNVSFNEIRYDDDAPCRNFKQVNA